MSGWNTDKNENDDTVSKYALLKEQNEKTIDVKPDDK